MIKGFIFSFLILISLGIVIGVGFHNANEVLPGTFDGDYKFTGNVGIGTSSPGANLEVKRDSASGWTNYLNAGSTANGLWIDTENTASSGYLIYGTTQNDLNKVFVVRSDGKVGIGTANPEATLHVKSENNGGIHVDINTANGPAGSAGIVVRNLNNSNGNSNGIMGYNSAMAMVSWIDLINMNHNSHGSQSGAIAFSTMNNGVQTQKMRITQEGNVGIGTTSPNAKLDVNGIIRVPEICDETGNNCKDISTGWGSSLSCTDRWVPNAQSATALCVTYGEVCTSQANDGNGWGFPCGQVRNDGNNINKARCCKIT